MKVDVKYLPKPFEPITITLESQTELSRLLGILIAYEEYEKFHKITKFNMDPRDYFDSFTGELRTKINLAIGK